VERKAWVLVLILVSVTTTLVLPALPALATCDTGEKNIEWNAIGPGGHYITNMYGVRSDITIKDRDLDSNCTSYGTLTGSTSLTIFSKDAKNWVEAGWREGWNSSGTGHQWHWFTELGILGVSTVQEGNPNSWPCTVNVGDAPRFDTHQTIDTTDWHQLINCLDGTGPHALGTDYTGTGWAVGRPQVETFRFGGTATGASDNHTSLEYRDCCGNWSSWINGGKCWDNTITNWQGEMPTNSTYDSFQKSNPVCVYP
jgi:hypothetical protein